MCWTIIKKNSDDNAKKYHNIAKKDIIVYKIGVKNYNNFRSYIYSDFHYKTNSLNDEISLEICECDIMDVILEGYHSYYGKCKIYYGKYKPDKVSVYNKEEIKIENYFSEGISFLYEIIGKFIIPKGSEYYKNAEGEIVSSQLVWTGKSYQLNKLKCDKMIKFKDLDYALENA